MTPDKHYTYSDFGFDSHVNVDGHKSVECVVTGFMQSRDRREVRVEWFHCGDLKEKWVEEQRLSWAEGHGPKAAEAGVKKKGDDIPF